MNILAEFKSLKEKLTGFLADQSKATSMSLSELSSKMSFLESGAVAQVETEQASNKDLSGKMAKANEDLSAATGQLNEIKATLAAAASALKLDVRAEASPVELITAMQGAVSTTLAKLNVPLNSIPAPKPTDNNQPKGKVMSLKEFAAMPAQQRMEFAREVNAGRARLSD